MTEGEAGKKRIHDLIPTYGDDMRLAANATKFAELQKRARQALQLV